ncbi:MAG: NTP transferase domain-containing protein [SAR324 cluster bacterium]|nr:NTP transferase domain-containing protein [SAR324 cluster bacterium]
MNTSVAILAGGLATRLRPLTKNLPKSMIEIHGKPFFEYQLALLKKQGLTNIVACVGYQGKQIEKYFGNGSRFGVNLQYSYDGKTLLGTGGSLRHAFPLLSEVFLVIYGDSYLDIEYAPVIQGFLKKYQGLPDSPLALMTVYKNDNQLEQSNVCFHEGNIIQYEKQNPTLEMKHIDWGLNIFSKQAFAESSFPTRFDLTDLYQQLIPAKKVMGHEVFQRYYEIGSHQGLEEFKELMQD